MQKVKTAIGAGISFGTAIKENLGAAVQSFCADNELPKTQFSEMLNGRRVPDNEQLKALIAAIGGTPQEWLDLWFASAQQRKVAAR